MQLMEASLHTILSTKMCSVERNVCSMQTKGIRNGFDACLLKFSNKGESERVRVRVRVRDETNELL